MSSHNRFGYEWDRYSQMTSRYEGQFLNWTHPSTSEYWRGKKVLDAGCGMGRNSFWPCTWGAEKVVAFDFDERSVSRAKETLKEFPQAKVFYKSIYDIDWHSEFDVAFSIGVIHHLKDPKLALRNMVKALRSGGELIVWVYSYEGNEWIVRFIDPIRIHLTSKLPPVIVHLLAYFCSIPLYCFAKLFRGPTAYIRQIASFDFWHLHSIVFDQLIPDVANYWRREAVRELVGGLPLVNVSVYAPPNGSGWILRGIKI